MTVSIEPDPTTLLGRYDMVAAWACIVLFFLILLIFAVMETYVYNIVIYRIVGYFRGENFCQFHKSGSICENFTLEMFIFQFVL